MISKNIMSFCINYKKIKNYKRAIFDTTQVWHCHHRKEIEEGKSSKQLIKEGLYYDRPPEEFIFVTKTEHQKIHSEDEAYKKRVSHKSNKPNLGRVFSDEWRQNMSNAKKIKPIWNKDKILTEEHKKKIAESVKKNWLKRKGLT